MLEAFWLKFWWRAANRAAAFWGCCLLFLPTGCGKHQMPDLVVDDQALAELQALEDLAERMEADMAAGSPAISELEAQLVARMSPEDTAVLLRSLLSFYEAASSFSDWQPDAEFFDLVDRLRDLPYFSDLPGRPGKPVGMSFALTQRTVPVVSSALFALPPTCLANCKLQAGIYLVGALGMELLQKHFLDLINGGVGCLKDVIAMADCAAGATNCNFGDLVLTVAGCAQFSLDVAFPGVSFVAKWVKTAWTLSTLAAGVAAWTNDCMDWQEEKCPNCTRKNQLFCDHCQAGERVCRSINGLDSFCCGESVGCLECGAQISEPCGNTACGTGERCVNPDLRICEVCRTPCGFGCCAGPMVCIAEHAALCVSPNSPCQGFECSDSSCLEGARVCDGTADCLDGADEELLECPLPCDGFRCTTGGCIPSALLCNGNLDCLDGSDEAVELCRPVDDWSGYWRGTYNLTLNDADSGCTFHHAGQLTLHIERNPQNAQYQGTFELTGVQVLQVPGCSLKETMSISGDLGSLSISGSNISADIEGVLLVGTRSGSGISGKLSAPEGSGSFSLSR